MTDELALFATTRVAPDWVVHHADFLRYAWVAPVVLQGLGVGCGIAAAARGARRAGRPLARDLTIAASVLCAAVFGVTLVRFAAVPDWQWAFDHPWLYSLLTAPLELGLGISLIMIATAHRKATRPNRSGDKRDWPRWRGWPSTAGGITTFARGLAGSVIATVAGYGVLLALSAGGLPTAAAYVWLGIAVGCAAALVAMLAGLARFALVPARTDARSVAVVALVLIAVASAHAWFVAVHVASATIGRAVLDVTSLHAFDQLETVSRALASAGTLVVLEALRRVARTIEASALARRAAALASIVALSGAGLVWSELQSGPDPSGSSLAVSLICGFGLLVATLALLRIAREVGDIIDDGVAERAPRWH